MAIGLGLFGNSLYQHFDKRDELTGHATISAVVERINAAESSGDPNLKDTHSSATGLGQLARRSASIGGAGTFDGIFLTGILAVLLAGLYARPRAARFR